MVALHFMEKKWLLLMQADTVFPSLVSYREISSTVGHSMNSVKDKNQSILLCVLCGYLCLICFLQQC